MKKFFVWFYNVCLRMNQTRAVGNYKDYEYPSEPDIKRLNQEFKERTKQ